MKWLKQIFITLSALLLLSYIGAAQLKTYSFEQADALQKKQKRNIAVFIYTDWCQYCQVMKRATFSNDQVVRKLNEQFYFVALNGEEKRDIRFNSNLFKYKPNGTNTGAHELAEVLGTIDGKLAYPGLIILNSRYEIIFQYSGFLNARALRTILDNTPR
jgi:thioredoxin-related protein